MQKLQILLSVILLFFPSLCFGGKDSLITIHYDINNGLPSNNVYTYLQDHNGYLWFATDNGVVKYNGYAFKIFNSDEGMPSSEVWKLTEDRYGRIWVSWHASQLGYIKDDVFKTIANYEIPKMLSINMRLDYRREPFFTYGNEHHLHVVQIDSNDRVVEHLSTGPHFAFLEDSSRILVVDDSLNSFFRVVLKNNSVKLESVCNNRFNVGFPSNYLLAQVKPGLFIMLRDNDNKVKWLDLNRCSTDSMAIPNLGADKTEYFYNSDIVNNTVTLFTQKAAYFLDTNLKLIKRINIARIFASNPQIAYWLKDRTANEWFATNKQGGYMLPAHYLTLHYHPLLNIREDNKFVGMLTDGTTCWWSASLKQIQCLDSTGQSKIFDIPYLVKSVAEDGYGNLLLGSLEGLYVLNRKTGGLKLMIEGRQIRFGGNAKSQFEKQNPEFNKNIKVYETFNVANILYFKPGKGVFTSYTDVKTLAYDASSITIELIASNRYTKAVQDPVRNLVWFYNRESLLVVDPQTDRSITIKSKVLRALGINIISGVAVDKYYNVYIASERSIFVYNTLTRNVDVVSVPINLSDLKMATYDNNLILAGKFGIAYAAIGRNCSMSAFTILPNVNANLYNNITDFFITANGIVYLSTDRGIYSTTVQEILSQKTAFNKIDNGFALTITTPFSKRVDDGDTIWVPQGNSSVTFDCINFYGNGNRYFVYKIGEEGAFQKTTSGEFLLTELQPGSAYKMQLYVVDDMWKSRLFSFYLFWRPHWYQTLIWKQIFWVAGVLGFVALIIFIILTTRYYVNRANEKKGRLLDLELRAVYSQINPHFIFNTLSSALFFINKKQFDEAYTHVSKFSRLLRSYLKSSQERYVTLSEEIGMLRNYIELQQIRFEEKFDYTISVDNKIPAENVKIPSLLLQPLIENAINHGLFHKQGKGNLAIKFEQGKSSDELICIIDDDGVGRVRASAINKGSSVKQESYGTRLTQKLIEIFREYEHMNIYLEYLDKKEPDTGTIVKLTLRNLKYDA